MLFVVIVVIVVAVVVVVVIVLHCLYPPGQNPYADVELEKNELEYKLTKERVDSRDTERLSMLSKRKEQRGKVESIKARNVEEVS